MALKRWFRRNARLWMAAAAIALAAILCAPPLRAQIALSAAVAPPMLPVYAQPVCPGEGYIWTPGYWAYGAEGYFWVPGTWVRPPRIGFLWTPAWWGWGGSGYLFHPGYWGPHVGFYGGINYGFGYGGLGYEGGYWHGNVFAYNRSVNNLNLGLVHSVYDHPVAMQNAAFNHVSYNGGNGGVPYRASAQELAAQREPHFQPTGQQIMHQGIASRDRAQFARFNNGRPSVTAASTPGAFRANPAHPAAGRGGFGGAYGVRALANQQHEAQQRFATGAVRSNAAPQGRYGGGRQFATQQPRFQQRSAPRAEGRSFGGGHFGGGGRGGGGGASRGGGGGRRR